MRKLFVSLTSIAAAPTAINWRRRLLPIIVVGGIAACGSSAGSHASARSCWNSAIRHLASRQVHEYLPPGTKGGEFARLNLQADIRVVNAWLAGKKVTLKATQPGATYRGPTRRWLETAKTRCGTPQEAL